VPEVNARFEQFFHGDDNCQVKPAFRWLIYVLADRGPGAGARETNRFGQQWNAGGCVFPPAEAVMTVARIAVEVRRPHRD
jgi:hypothetical protein